MVFSALKEDLKTQLTQINPIFSTGRKWTRTHYILMADLIEDHLNNELILTDEQKEEMGSSISYATLRRFFENTDMEPSSLDLRHIKTLDKLAIFLKYESYIDYCKKNNAALYASKSDTCKNVFFRKFIEDFLACEFSMYQALPSDKFAELSEFLMPDSPVYSRMHANFERMLEKGFRMVQDGNRSNFEILDCNVLSHEPNKCIVETKEFWNLLFVNDDDNEYVFNIVNEQLYIIHLTEQGWKIWDNFNPDEGNIKKKIDMGG